MDLKRERQIKFWLTTISKVLIITLLLYKAWDLFIKDKDPLSNELLPNQTVLQEKTPVDSTMGMTNTKKKSNTDQPEKKTAFTNTLAEQPPNTSVKTDNNTTTNNSSPPTRPTYASIGLKEDGFTWYRDTKAVLKIYNSTLTAALQINAMALLTYATETKSVSFKTESSIAPNGTATLEIALSELPKGKLPDTITLCMTHESESLKKKNWYKYVLGNRVSGPGAIEVRSIVYKVLSKNTSQYTGNPPNCSLPSAQKKTIQPQLTTPIDVKKDADTEAKEKIAATASLFINGLNNKSLITLKNTCTDQLYSHILKGDHKTYAYGFSTQVKITAINSATATVQLALTEKGRNNYLNQQATYEAAKSNKKASELFNFLKRKGGAWTGHMVKQNGLWKFDVY